MIHQGLKKQRRRGGFVSALNRPLEGAVAQRLGVLWQRSGKQAGVEAYFRRTRELPHPCGSGSMKTKSPNGQGDTLRRWRGTSLKGGVRGSQVAVNNITWSVVMCTTPRFLYVILAQVRHERSARLTSVIHQGLKKQRRRGGFISAPTAPWRGLSRQRGPKVMPVVLGV